MVDVGLGISRMTAHYRIRIFSFLSFLFLLFLCTCILTYPPPANLPSVQVGPISPFHLFYLLPHTLSSIQCDSQLSSCACGTNGKILLLLLLLLVVLAYYDILPSVVNAPSH